MNNIFGNETTNEFKFLSVLLTTNWILLTKSENSVSLDQQLSIAIELAL